MAKLDADSLLSFPENAVFRKTGNTILKGITAAFAIPPVGKSQSDSGHFFHKAERMLLTHTIFRSKVILQIILLLIEGGTKND